jgi:hypothetical protein
VPPSQNYKFIWQPIRRRQPVAFLYTGKPRTACPIVLGYSANGREALSAYQVAGETSGGRTLPQWRCFYLDAPRGARATATDSRRLVFVSSTLM